MPTGYTSAIKNGVSFKEFTWGCARAFGALITMRDEPMDAPIPEKFEAETYYAEELKKEEAALARYQKMTIEEAEIENKREFDAQVEINNRAIADAKDLREKYHAMLAQAVQWVAPTAAHENLKQFMIDQIQQSFLHDCDVSYREKNPPVMVTTEIWLAAKIEVAQRNIAYYTDANNKEIQRTNERNAWIAALRESLG